MGDGVRVVRDLSGYRPPVVAGVAVSDDHIFWVETGESTGGGRETTVWRAGLSGGSPRRLGADTSDIRNHDSAYDVQVADGQVHWAAASTDPERGEIRSVSVQGGPVRVRRLDRPYALTAWPWATTSPNGEAGAVDLLNLTTGERRVVPAGPDEFLACAPDWCRVTALVDGRQNVVYAIQRPDGSDRRPLGDATLTPLNVDVALLDRFEVLATPTAPTAEGVAQRLSLYDLRDDRTVVVAEGTTGTIGSRDGYLWWSTGDNEALTWHVLDLRQLD
jgi:hypothetical protein